MIFLLTLNTWKILARTVLVDTGPLVALIDRHDSRHSWASAKMDSFSSPMITCTAVISEAVFLLNYLNNGVETLFSFIDEGIVEVRNPYPDKKDVIHKLTLKYDNISPSLADLCLVVMTEEFNSCEVFTIDSDFLVYRDSNGTRLDLISPYKS